MIIVKLKGGMGNQMFQYALGRALSLKNNTNLGLDLSYLLDKTPRPNFTFRDYDLDVFNIDAEIIPQSKISLTYNKFKGKLGLYLDYLFCKYFKLPGREKSHNFDTSILSLGSKIKLDGYWQSPKYFENIEDIIRKDFTLKNHLSKKSQELFNEIKSKNSLCINVRRGDFVGNPFHDIVGRDYYSRGIEYLKTLQNIEKIYIFSDDTEWCKNNLDFSIPTQIVEHDYKGYKFEEYLYLMSACKYFIIPNSTFAWWGAWLNPSDDKIVIVPKQWFGDLNISSDDLIPEGWVRI